MDVQRVLRMKEGTEKESYANNSQYQGKALTMANKILEESIQELCRSTLPECLKIADLGCSSGPNSLAVLSKIIAFTNESYRTLNRQLPEFKIFLNDLPGNDFNTIFRSLPNLQKMHQQEKGIDVEVPCFISGIPGSFYGRLFPQKFLHFVYSSYSLHWLSQVPEELVKENGESLNRGNIHMSKTSPLEVQKAFKKQFDWDFTLFLSLRSKEIIPKGRMVLIIMATIESGEPHPGSVWELLGMTLKDMALEGLIEEEKLDAFNLPIYNPSVGEVKKLIEDEGSFTLHQIETFTTRFVDFMNKEEDANEIRKQAHMGALCIRAVVEPILANEFGQVIMDDLFSRYEKKILNIAATMAIETHIVVTSIERKG
ncbi:hypothetical protein Nepgr_004852 [Nepenthes gracilis]|uniref:Uncharacterized protein n=1 Tax=Nepenthes gracilis TaxID=150966 RepID=A0AAD3XFN0_NEPGR|nr:hypothetical protein Nepgr_004852 [Nepenthes gracilis]